MQQLQAAERLHQDAGLGGCLIGDGRFIKGISSSGSNELPRNWEMRITGRFGEGFKDHLIDPNTGTYFRHIVADFHHLPSNEVWNDCLCELTQPQGQPYRRFAIPKDEEADYIIDFDLGDVYTIECNGYKIRPVVGRVPSLVVKVYPPGVEGVALALQVGIEGNLSPVFLPQPGEIVGGLIPDQANAGDIQNRFQQAPGARQRNEPGRLNVQLAAGPAPVVSLYDAGMKRFNALTLNYNDPGLSPYIKNCVTTASRRWLRKNELHEILEEFHQLQGVVQWPTHASKTLPQAGQLYIFHKGTCCEQFNEDGHDWGDSRRSQKLKINGIDTIQVMYYSSAPSSISRRLYWLLDSSRIDTVLVHYLPRTEPTPPPKDPGQSSRPACEGRDGINVAVTKLNFDPTSPSDTDLDRRKDADYVVSDEEEEGESQDMHGLVSEQSGGVEPIAPVRAARPPNPSVQPPVPVADNPTPSVIGNAEALNRILQGVDMPDVQMRLREERKINRGAAVGAGAAAHSHMDRLANQADDEDLSNKLRAMDVDEPSVANSFEPSPAQSVYHDPRASGSRPPGRPKQGASLTPSAPDPPSGAPKGDLVDVKAGAEAFLHSYNVMTQRIADLERQVSHLESQLVKEIEAKEAKDADHEVTLQQVIDENSAMQQQLAAANEDAAAAQSEAAGLLQQVNSLKAQILERDNGLAAQKTKYKKKREEYNSMKEEVREAKRAKRRLQKAKEILDHYESDSQSGNSQNASKSNMSSVSDG